MSQHALTIANQAGASFRSDIVNALQALGSLTSGASAPGTTYAYMFWADTTTGILKQRNAANSAWISLLTMSTGFPLSAAAPGANADITSLTYSGGVAVKGIPNAGAATAGYVGETIESVVGSTSAPSSGAYGDLTSITLTAGDWDLGAMVVGELNGATLTSMQAGIGSTTGNNGSGLQYGDTTGDFLPTSANRAGVAIPPRVVKLSGTTTYYLKMLAVYSAGTPKFYGRLSARRMR